MPRTSNSVTNPALLEAALEGLKLQRERLDEQIMEVERMLRGRGGTRQARAEQPGPAAKSAGQRRQLSPAARKRIAAAQKKRWAEYRKQSDGSESAAPSKRAGGPKKARGPRKTGAAKQQ